MLPRSLQWYSGIKKTEIWGHADFLKVSDQKHDQKYDRSDQKYDLTPIFLKILFKKVADFLNAGVS